MIWLLLHLEHPSVPGSGNTQKDSNVNAHQPGTLTSDNNLIISSDAIGKLQGQEQEVYQVMKIEECSIFRIAYLSAPFNEQHCPTYDDVNDDH